MKIQKATALNRTNLMQQKGLHPNQQRALKNTAFQMDSEEAVSCVSY